MIPNHSVRQLIDAFHQAATDACGLKPGARVFALFDGEDDRQDWWGGTVVDVTNYIGQGEELTIVFDDGSDHRLWAYDVARALPASICGGGVS